MPRDVSEFAPAKVNLCLHVTGQRSDGYHLLDSLVAFADVGDELKVDPADEFSLSIVGPFGANLESEPDNLIVRAARDLDPRLSGIKIELMKNLPMASGIGGGSADAAATMRALIRLFEIDAFSADELDQIALALGADVPACFRSRALRMSGIGEEIALVQPLPAVPALLVNPLVPVPTGSVFAELGLKPGEYTGDGLTDFPTSGFSTVADLATWLHQQRNDLEPPAVSLVPAISEVLNTIGAQAGCLLVRMSGSGATCFGLFETDKSAADAAQAVKRLKPGWWIAETNLR